MSKKCPNGVWGGREEHEQALESPKAPGGGLRFQLGARGQPHTLSQGSPDTELKGISAGQMRIYCRQ